MRFLVSIHLATVPTRRPTSRMLEKSYVDEDELPSGTRLARTPPEEPQDVVPSIETATPHADTPRPPIWVDTAWAVRDMLRAFCDLPAQPPRTLYVDLEGVRLSRHGSISLLQLWIPQHAQAFVVDIHTLGAQAFDTAFEDRLTLRLVLESKFVAKYFFDVRNDSDALFAHFGIRLAGVVDVQLLEMACRTGARDKVKSLAHCIEEAQVLSQTEAQRWVDRKEKVVHMFDSSYGGSYEVFNARPLDPLLLEYCVGDVTILSTLAASYTEKLTEQWVEQVRVESARRVDASQQHGYLPQGPHKAYGPSAWRPA
ncbi:hypothetical protein LTR53_012772 [Teratosphaeriaceae sp. CCFEE 6253]|nr:hypothetical protein LTR53_012772 [Teratosphaeriaceae sp. CCFEE 6253]